MPNNIFQNMTTPSPALRDIFRFTPYTGSVNDNPYRMVNNTDMNDEQFYGLHSGMDTFERVHDLHPGDPDYEYSRGWQVRPDSWLAQLGNKYQGFTTTMERSNNEARDWQFGANWAALPKTRFGTVDKVIPVNNMKDVADPRFVYDDPNYGKITPHWNRKKDWKDMVPQLAMSAAMMGMGGLMAPGMLAAGVPASLAGSVPSTVMAAARAGAGALDGKGLGGFLPLLLSVGAGSLGSLGQMGGQAAQMMRYAKPLMAIANMYRQSQRRRG